jgi:hypothetical protein
MRTFYPIIMLFIFSFFLLVSCKKSQNENKIDTISLKAGGKKHSFDKLQLTYNPSVTSYSSNFKASTFDGRKTIEFLLIGFLDLSLIGKHEIRYDPNWQGPYKGVRNLSITIIDENTGMRFVYFSASQDFIVTVTSFDVANKRIVGYFSGNMEGGHPTPGGFGGIGYYDVRTDFIEGNFDTIYEPF